MNFRDPDWREINSGEYVLGTMNDEDTDRFNQELIHDRELQKTVVDWQERLQPLADSIEKIDPPQGVWRRIIGQINDHQSKPIDTHLHNRHSMHEERIRSGQKVRQWKRFAALSAAASVVLATLLWKQTTPTTQLQYNAMTVVSSDTSSVLWVIDASLASRKLRITAINPPAIDIDQVHQLWMIDPASDGVKSLGLLPQTPHTTVTLRSSEINGNVATLAVSLEPVGGSPLSGPSGPVLYQGDFTLLNNSDEI